MRFNFLLVIIILFGNISFAQMPTEDNPDFSNWNWEDPSQANWKTKVGNNWIDIPPPFSPTAERAGLMVDIHASGDYTKALGWQLVWAQFNNNGYPYFILYNQHKSVIRAFFYLNERPFTQVLATLTFHDINNPGVLTFGEEYQTASDQYFNNTTISDNDLVAVVIPRIGIHNWGAADFPIMYDNNIRDIKYKDKKWVFTFYGCENSSIKLYGKESTDPDQIILQDQFTVQGNKTSISGNKFAADYAKLHKEIQSIEKFLKDMHTSVNTIDTSSAKFLQSYKGNVDGLKNITDVVSAVSSFSSAASAIFGFFKIISGSFNDTETTKPAATTQYVQLEGSMDIKYTLKAQTISIPGLSSSYYPSGLAWQPFNCPMGSINLQTTPNIKVTTAYEKYGYYESDLTYGWQGGQIVWINNIDGYPSLAAPGSHPLVTTYSVKYPGKFKKYKLDENIVLTRQELSGLQLVEVRFAIVCKPNGIGDRKYKIQSKYLAYHKFWDYLPHEYHLPVENPVYKALSEGRFIVHKFDEDNDEVYFGTPFMPMNQLKGVVVEVPEDTDVKLGVLVKFTSDKYETPIIFKAVYNLNPVEEAATMSRVFCSLQQSNFPFSDYYNTSSYTLNNNPNSGQYTAAIIEMNPGFIGVPTFTATATNLYKGVFGNTQINVTNFNCTSGLKSSKENIEFVENNLIPSKYQDFKPVLFPNPTNGIVTILSIDENIIESVELYTLIGEKVLCLTAINKPSKDIDISDLPTGVYFVKTCIGGTFYVDKLVLNY